MAGLEPAGDLLRGPSFGEAITDEVPQPAIPFEDGFTPSAPLIGSGGVERRRAATGQGVSAQLPRHGGFGPPHRLGDGADRTASRRYYPPPRRHVFLTFDQQVTPISNRYRVESNYWRDASSAASCQAVWVVSSGKLLA